MERPSIMRQTLKIAASALKNESRDYTSNLSSLINDANDIRTSVMQTGKTAAETFSKMKSTGGIKNFINWFYEKESDTGEYSFDNNDEFDAGFKNDSSDDSEGSNTASLDYESMRDITRGQVNAMYSIGGKQVEASAMNTAEIITTINARSAELTAAVNNINSTLLTISGKLDTMIQMNPAYAILNSKNQKSDDGLFDYEGNITLGSIKNLIKKQTESYSGYLDLLKTGLSQFGPSDVLGLGLGALKERKFAKLGNKSVDDIGKAFNDYVGNTITYAFMKVLDNDFIKNTLNIGVPKNKNFKAYIENRYTSDPVVFDGMTKQTIVEIIPGYLKEIASSLSGKVLEINQYGHLTDKPVNTFASVADGMTYGFSLSNQAMARVQTNRNVSRKDINDAVQALTGICVFYLYSHGGVFTVDTLENNAPEIVSKAAERLSSTDKKYNYWFDVCESIVYEMTHTNIFGSGSGMNFVKNVQAKVDTLLKRGKEAAKNPATHVSDIGPITEDMIFATFKQSRDVNEIQESFRQRRENLKSESLSKKDRIRKTRELEKEEKEALEAYKAEVIYNQSSISGNISSSNGKNIRTYVSDIYDLLKHGIKVFISDRSFDENIETVETVDDDDFKADKKIKTSHVGFIETTITSSDIVRTESISESDKQNQQLALSMAQTSVANGSTTEDIGPIKRVIGKIKNPDLRQTLDREVTSLLKRNDQTDDGKLKTKHSGLLSGLGSLLFGGAKKFLAPVLTLLTPVTSLVRFITKPIMNLFKNRINKGKEQISEGVSDLKEFSVNTVIDKFGFKDKTADIIRNIFSIKKPQKKDPDKKDPNEVDPDNKITGDASDIAKDVADGATGAVGGAIEGAASGAAAGPWGAVAGAALGILSGVTKIASSVGGMALSVVAGFSAVKTLTKNVGRIWKGLRPLNKAFRTLSNTLKPIFTSSRNLLKELSKSFVDIINPFIKEFAPVGKIIAEGIDETTPLIKDFFKEIKPIVKELTPFLAEMTKVQIKEILFGVKTYITFATGMMKFYKGFIQLRTAPVKWFNKIIHSTSTEGIDITKHLIKPMTKAFPLLGTAMEKLVPYLNRATKFQKAIIKGANLVLTGIEGILSWMNRSLTANDDSEKKQQQISTYRQEAYIPNIQRMISNLEGSGDSNYLKQGNYNSLNMSNRGCGPIALADAYSRRTGRAVNPETLAAIMSNHGTYDPRRGTSVDGYMSASNALGMNVTAGGVTQRSLRLASPYNPITVIGSGTGYGTKTGNAHYVNVVGTDNRGGAYVLNPLTGKVSRTSSMMLANNSIAGLYGAGEDDENPNMLSNVANGVSRIGSIAGLTLAPISTIATAASIASNITNGNSNPSNATNGISDPSEAMDIMSDASKLDNYAIGDTISDAIGQLSELASSILGIFTGEYSSPDEFDIDVGSAGTSSNTSGPSQNSSGGGSFVSNNGVQLGANYKPEYTTVNVTNSGSGKMTETPIHEFFAKTIGQPYAYSANGNWYKQRNNPNSTGQGTAGDSHSGVDILVPDRSGNVPIYSTSDGIVADVRSGVTGFDNTNHTAGNAVYVTDSAGYKHRYMHFANATPLVHKGDSVIGGKTLLGYMGNTGWSYGTHLHYDISDPNGNTVNPMTYFSYVPSATMNDGFNYYQAGKSVTSIIPSVIKAYEAAGIVGNKGDYDQSGRTVTLNVNGRKLSERPDCTGLIDTIIDVMGYQSNGMNSNGLQNATSIKDANGNASNDWIAISNPSLSDLQEGDIAIIYKNGIHHGEVISGTNGSKVYGWNYGGESGMQRALKSANMMLQGADPYQSTVDANSTVNYHGSYTKLWRHIKPVAGNTSLTGNTNKQKIWNYLRGKGLTPEGAAGLMGNLQAESGLESNNLQNSFNRKFGITDDAYTSMVDSGSYTQFVNDSAGYGLAQWTVSDRKQKLLDAKNRSNVSIGDLGMQLDYLYDEMTSSYPTLWNKLQKSTNVQMASNDVLHDFERPSNQSASVERSRGNNGMAIYNEMSSISGSGDISIPPLDRSVFTRMGSGDTDQKQIVYNRYEIQANHEYEQETLHKIMTNTYNVKAERVEELLEMIVDKLDDFDPKNKPTPRSTPSSTPIQYYSDEVPTQIQKLAQG